MENSETEYPEDQGIVLANQTQWTLSTLIVAMDRLLSETKAEDWSGQSAAECSSADQEFSPGESPLD